MVDSVIVTAAEDGARLERWLKKKYPALAFGQMQKILRTGQVRVDGKRVKGDERLVEGQTVRIPPQLAPGAEKPRGLSAKNTEFIRSLVLYEDEHVIAINKPPGLATQGGSKIKYHIDGLLEGLAKDGVKPHLVHRLDKDTSGVLLLARNPKIAKALGELFSSRDIRKYYWAITVPTPIPHQGKLKSPIAKSGENGREKVRPDAGGKYALTYYQVIETASAKLAWVAFWPRTGRTHQIRVHAQEMGTPLLGDYKYGGGTMEGLPDMLHLHARRIILPHPVTGRKLDITAPLGSEMRKTWKFFNFNPDDKSDPFEEIL